ncbi:MAG: hypothetical protein ACP5JZ_02250, partial [Thermosulfidibacteraceae bacterium]
LQFPREAIVGWIIDCNTRKAGIFSLTFYDKNGKILHPSSKRYEPEFLVSLEPVEPYSIEEKIVFYSCLYYFEKIGFEFLKEKNIKMPF